MEDGQREGKKNTFFCWHRKPQVVISGQRQTQQFWAYVIDINLKCQNVNIRFISNSIRWNCECDWIFDFPWQFGNFNFFFSLSLFIDTGSTNLGDTARNGIAAHAKIFIVIYKDQDILLFTLFSGSMIPNCFLLQRNWRHAGQCDKNEEQFNICNCLFSTLSKFSEKLMAFFNFVLNNWSKRVKCHTHSEQMFRTLFNVTVRWYYCSDFE